MGAYIPKYLKANQLGLLLEKAQQAEALLNHCTLCPRRCLVDRSQGEKGYCSTGEMASISSWMPHFGEEPQLVGKKGSGTIFFSNCNLKCVFCQNYDISIEGAGQKAEDGQIAAIMLHLQSTGCHNINLVTPSHVVPQILNALDIAAENGLNIPLVYNCSGYESLETLKILDGVVDIYMPDFKFWNPQVAIKCCKAEDYPQRARAALKEMYAQTGGLKADENGIAISGLLVRHLVMPGGLDDTFQILKFLKESISPNTFVNVMSQYHPAGEADSIREISRQLTPGEFKKAVEMAGKFKLNLIR